MKYYFSYVSFYLIYHQKDVNSFNIIYHKWRQGSSYFSTFTYVLYMSWIALQFLEVNYVL